ncbi:MAG: DUF692 domain-containing protein [Bdellovibrionota bacterium]
MAKPAVLFPDLGFGLGLRPDHFAQVLEGRPSLSWFEIVSENFMGEGGRPHYVLEKIRSQAQLAFHGVSLSIGSVDPLKKDYLKKLKALVDRFEPAIVSDHLCWTGVEGVNLHDLLPLPYTREAVDHVVARVSQAQDFLKRRILLENVSSYLTYAHSEMTEWEFLAEISKRADCGLLLDVNNVYVSAINHGFDPLEYLGSMPRERVGQVHLAGHSTRKTPEGKTYLIDTHDHPVCDEVWRLYEWVTRSFGPVSTMIERDADIPALESLEQELDRARQIHQETFRAKQDRNPAPTPFERTAVVDAAGAHPA